MELKKVSFETAKKLKEVGFNEPSDDCYNKNGKLYSDGWVEYLYEVDDQSSFTNINLKETDTLVPTLALVQMWLEEVHDIFISFKRLMGSQSENFPSGWHYMFIINGKVNNKHYGSKNKALEVCILEAIKLIKTR